MRYFIILICFLCFQSVEAKKQKPVTSIDLQEKTFQSFFKALSTTNNTHVFLKNLNLSPQFQNQLTNTLKGSKNQMFQARKLSKTSFEIKLINGRWARFDLKPAEGLLIGKKSFKWNFSKSTQDNLVEISSILKSEYSEKAYQDPQSFLFPHAYADVNIYDPNAVIVGGVGAVIQSSFQADQFLNSAEYYCDNGSLPPSLSIANLLDGNISKQQNPYTDRTWVRRRFFEIRNHFTQQTWSEYLISANIRYLPEGFNKFYKVQDCFRNKKFIDQTETREHPGNKDPYGNGSPQVSQ